ncbi:MAG TPA: OsmC family protein [Terriglobales bacterium]|nr:OsmC family protein [Terriglobales bacterium]
MATNEIKIVFGGDLKVDVEHKGFRVPTDQPVREGGGGTAPSPFDYFLISLAACAGYYALEFCRAREIPTEKLGVSMTTERGAASKMIEKISFRLDLPPDFPPRYREAIVKAVDHCTVKAHILRPPRFEIVVAPSE